MFMKRLSRFGVLAVAAVMIAALATPAVMAAGKVYVGDLVQGIALHKGLRAGDPVTAAASLREAGVRLPQNLNLDQELTEGDMAAVATAAGVPVTTTRPAAPVSGDQLDSFFSTFGKDLGSGGDGRADTRKHPNPGTDKGKGKKVGHFKSPTDPV